jgi:hypothetical protein
MSAKTQLASLWGIQVLGNAVLLASAWWWLSWPDARVWQVAASFVTAAILVLLALYVHGATLGYFAGTESLAEAFRRGARRLPALLVWLIVFATILLLLQWIKGVLPQASVRVAQVSGINPRAVTSTAGWVIFVVQWMIVPVVLLPFATEVSAEGFGGWRIGALRRLRQGVYWIGCAVALVIGAYVPYKLVWWVPRTSSLKQQAWSMGIRFVAAYLLAVTAWMIFAAVLGRGRRRALSTAAEQN